MSWKYVHHVYCNYALITGIRAGSQNIKAAFYINHANRLLLVIFFYFFLKSQSFPSDRTEGFEGLKYRTM